MMKASMGVLAVALVMGGCHSSAEPETPATMHCRRGPADDVKMAGRTAADSVEGGVETGVAGVKQAGRTAAGWVRGGSDRAEREWNTGKAETKQEARELSSDVQAETSLPICPE